MPKYNGSQSRVTLAYPVDHHSSRRESNVTASTQDFLQLGASRITLLSGPLQAQDVRSQLVQAREILELGLENVSYARQVVALSDGKNIADVGWAQVGWNCISETVGRM